MSSKSPETFRSAKKQVAFRLGGVMVGLALLICLEGVLRLANLGRIEDVGDPYVGFSETVPLFVLNDAGDRYETAKARDNWFRPDSFAANKADNEYRVFCLGGSTVQGRPYAIETSFTRWLELTLQAGDPERTFRVVNCGGISYASYRLLPILKETLSYEPDLFIVYTGHNEFLEERTYGDLKQEPAWYTALHEYAMQSRIYGVARRVLAATDVPSPKTNLPKEVDALLDYQGGLSKYHRDDRWHAGVVAHYEHNLRRMVRIANSADVPILLANPVSNIGDTPSFKVELPGSLSSDERARFESQWRQAKKASWEDLDAKLRIVEAALRIAPRHAEALFLRAKVLEAAGRIDEAREAYLRAKDEDICPLRMTERMHDALRRVARQTATTLIDVRGYFESIAENGIPGDDQLIDHVHPRIPGHQQIAELIFQEMVRQGTVVPRGGWETKRDQLFKENFASLPSSYFPDSLARLEGLQGSARGRAMKMRLPPKEDSSTGTNESTP